MRKFIAATILLVIGYSVFSQPLQPTLVVERGNHKYVFPTGKKLLIKYFHDGQIEKLRSFYSGVKGDSVVMISKKEL